MIRDLQRPRIVCSAISVELATLTIQQSGTVTYWLTDTNSTTVSRTGAQCLVLLRDVRLLEISVYRPFTFPIEPLATGH